MSVAVDPLPCNRIKTRVERITDALTKPSVGDAVELGSEESAYDRANGVRAMHTASHQVEELLGVDLAERRSVRAPNLIGLDLQSGNRIGMRRGRKQQVPVFLL